MCVRFAPIFWDFNVWKCYIPKWLIIYCSPIIHKLREPTQNGVIQFMVTKRGQISKWIWVSKPQPTIGIWLCMSFRWKSQLHTLHRDLSFDAILRAFFVVRQIEMRYSKVLSSDSFGCFFTYVRRFFDLDKIWTCEKILRRPWNISEPLRTL